MNVFRAAYQRWLAKRLPAANEHRLHQGNLFIFLNRAAIFYLLIAVLVWIGASNFENNLAYSLSFLMVATLITTIGFTFYNVSGTRLRFLPVSPCYAGEAVSVAVLLQSQRPRSQLCLQFAGGNPATVSFEREYLVNLNATAQRRGQRRLPRLRLEGVYPLGIISCWTYLYSEQRFWVYPQPLVCEPDSCLSGKSRLRAEQQLSDGEDFHSLKSYRQGDPLTRVAWKRYAAGRGLLVQEYAAALAQGDWWLDYERLSDDSETRLSKLCYSALQLHQQGVRFGLKLPCTHVEQGGGALHLQAVLQALAGFGQVDDDPAD